MRKLKDVVTSPSAFDSLKNFSGPLPDDEWDCLLTQTRDSNCLEVSNFRSALKQLGGEGDNVEVLRFGHWACGWWQALAVRCGTSEHRQAELIAARLEDYPVVSEDDWTELEYETANDVWRDCYRPEDRVKYMRRHRGEFTGFSWSELRAQVRGEWFGGDAGSLLR